MMLQPLLGVSVHADVLPALIISEVKIRNDATGFDEYIEIYNPGIENISLNDYFIGYLNTPSPSTGQLLTKFVIAQELLPAGQSVLLAKNELDINLPNAKPSPFGSLSDSGGILEISDASNNVIDRFAWTSTQSLAIDPLQYICTTSTVACNVNKTQSFQRSKDTNNQFMLVNPSWGLLIPTPISAILLPNPIPTPEIEPNPTPPVSDDQPSDTPDPLPEQQNTDIPISNTQTPIVPQTPVTPNLLPPVITELFPNPAAPASDSSDEFVELQNPNNEPIDISEYKLQTGNSFSYNYTFKNTVLAGNSYQAFLVSQTGNILSNAGGMARLLDPEGKVVAQTNAYESAEDGESWSLINGAWQWTTTPTPNAPNELTLPIVKIATSTVKTKSPTVKKVAAAKKPAKSKSPAKTKAKVASAKKTSNKTTPERQVYEEPITEEIAPIHPAILAGVGSMTILYAIYEYRFDAINIVKRFRRHREIRRTAG